MKNRISNLVHAAKTCLTAQSLLVMSTFALLPSILVSPASGQEIRIARQTQDGSQAANGSESARSCAQNYHASLSTVKATEGAKLTSSARHVRTGKPDLPGYWLFWNPQRAAVRKKLARIGNPANAIVIEDRMCARSVLGRGGRIRCLKWVPKPENYRPSPVVPTETEWTEPSAEASQRGLLRRLTPVVRSRGAVQELRRSGRSYELTRRAGGELIGYLNQPARPTICTGAQAMLDFYERQLRPLENQFNGAEELIKNTQELALKLTARARVAWSKPEGGATTTVGESSTAAQSSDTTDDAMKPLPAVWRDASEKKLIQLTAGIMLPRRHVGYIASEDAYFDRLVRAREAMSSASANEAPAHVRSAVFQAFRSLEMAYYARLRKDQVQAYRNALFGVIDAIGKRHSELCTCSPQ